MMTFLTNFLLSLFFVTSSPTYHPTLQADPGYKFTVKVNGVVDSTCYLGHYYGQYQYVDDTAVANAKGEMVFQGKEALPGGIYFVIIPKKKYFEFIVNKEEVFSMETDTSDFVKYMKVKGSAENKLFYEYLNYVNGNQNQFLAIKKRLDLNKGNKDSTAILNKQLEAVDQKVKDYKLEFIKKNPDSFISRIFISSKDPDVPKTPILPNGRKDSVFEYNAYKDHYWDNIDFSDERIIRTPVFYNRINNFFNNIVIQHPDSICKEADKLVEKARANKEMFKYVIWWITYTYETSKIIGFDAVFVHMVETYYMTNQCYWLSPTLLENITKRAMKLKPILLGKVAPHMVMQDTNLVLQSLDAVVAKYTIVMFWDYNCGHCKVEVPKMVEFYNKKKDELGLKVFAVCTDTSMAEMKKFIIKDKMNFINVDGPRAITPHYAELYDIYSTPVIYLLDDKKIIISKRIEVDQIEDIIKHDIKMKALQKK
ncbi:MAG: redoxin domain-containing protein [Bacteroidota bacterium]